MHFADHFTHPATLNSCRLIQNLSDRSMAFWAESNPECARAKPGLPCQSQTAQVASCFSKNRPADLKNGIFSPVLLDFEAFLGHFLPFSEAFLTPSKATSAENKWVRSTVTPKNGTPPPPPFTV
jgi:hypothetical protein